MHWHRLGERCGCGHLSVPARFYKDATQKQAEAAYLGFLKENMPARYEKLTVRRDEAPVTKRGRPRKHKDNAERQKAYRGKRGS